jgi:hypothetical protein
MTETRTRAVRITPSEARNQIQGEIRKYGHPIREKMFCPYSPVKGGKNTDRKYGNTEILSEFRAVAP